MFTEKFKNISLGCFGCAGTFVLLFVVFGILVLIGFADTVFKNFRAEETNKVSFKYDPASLKEVYLSGFKEITSRTPKIAVIRIKGVMVTDPDRSFGNYCDSRTVCLQIRRAAMDPSVKGVILELDTPGGEVAAADAIYQEIASLRSQTRKSIVAAIRHDPAQFFNFCVHKRKILNVWMIKLYLASGIQEKVDEK